MELDLNREDVQMIINALEILDPDGIDARERRMELIDMFETYLEDPNNF